MFKYSGLALLALLSSSSVFASGGFAVIVWNPQTVSVGSSHGAATRASAEAAALAYCGAGCAGVSVADLEAGQGAVRETWSLNGWVALATDNGGRWFASGVHTDRGSSERTALNGCGDSNCFVVRSLASYANQGDVDGTDNVAGLHGIPPVVSAGFYCAAACLTYQNAPDLRYTAGASAAFQAEAQQDAINATQSRFSCNYGVAVVGCSAQEHGNVFDAAAACTNYQGSADLRYIADGQGNSLLEAQTNARQAIQNKSSCNYGVFDVTSSEGLLRAYCSVACLDYQGNPDLRYSTGSEGRNKTDATVVALIANQAKYSCNYGQVVTSCN